jgi:hypothetical protein
MRVKVPSKLDERMFLRLARKWESSDYAVLTIARPESPAEADAMADFLLHRLPHKFAFIVLGELAEDACLSDQVLERIFDEGDESCKVSVCLRLQLPNALRKKCRDSEIASVKEHYVRNGRPP